MGQINVISCSREPWNRQAHWTKTPLKLGEIWAIRIRLQIASRIRDLALFDLAIDSKLRACDLVKLRVRDVCQGDRVATRAIVMQPLIYRRTKNLHAVQPLLGHKTLEGTVRYFGIEVDDALEMAEQMKNVRPSQQAGISRLSEGRRDAAKTSRSNHPESAVEGSTLMLAPA